MTFKNTNDFLTFLKDRLTLEDGELPVPGEWANMGNTIVAIALRSGLLSLEQIEQTSTAFEQRVEQRPIVDWLGVHGAQVHDVGQLDRLERLRQGLPRLGRGEVGLKTLRPHTRVARTRSDAERPPAPCWFTPTRRPPSRRLALFSCRRPGVFPRPRATQ